MLGSPNLAFGIDLAEVAGSLLFVLLRCTGVVAVEWGVNWNPNMDFF